jgi:hypothetical protein
MAKHVLSRNDIQALAGRLLSRGMSPLMDDMPETQRDIRLAALVLQYVASLGVPPTPITVENGNGWNT